MKPVLTMIIAIVTILAAGYIGLLAINYHAPDNQEGASPLPWVSFRSEVEGFDDRIILHLIPVGGDVETGLAHWSVAEDCTTIIERKNQRISSITAEDHIILEIPRKAGSEYTVRMKISSPDDRELENSTLTIGPLSASS